MCPIMKIPILWYSMSWYETALWKKRGIAFHCNTIKVYCINTVSIHTYTYIYIYIYELYTLDVDYHWLICFYHVICMKQDPDHHIKVLKLWILCAAPGSGGSGPTPVGGWSRGGCHTNNRGFLVAATTIPKKHPVILTMGWWWLMNWWIDWSLPFFKAPHDINHHPWLIGHHPRNGCPWRVMKVPGTLNSTQKHTENRIISY